MDFAQLVRQARSYRRFDRKRPVQLDDLRSLVELARLSSSGGNQQPLRYFLVCGPAACARVFPHIAWAGALKDWPGPAESERPTGYIAILGKSGGTDANTGIAAQTIQLAATANGLGVCMLGAIERDALVKVLDLPEQWHIKLLLAVGVPAETVVVEDISAGESLSYYRSADDVHHVPKLRLEELIVGSLSS